MMTIGLAVILAAVALYVVAEEKRALAYAKVLAK